MQEFTMKERSTQRLEHSIDSKEQGLLLERHWDNCMMGKKLVGNPKEQLGIPMELLEQCCSKEWEWR
jgi:hypothetical protein